MYVSEFQRHEVFKWLEEQLGPERAAIMMDLLPPVGWGDITTKTDLRTDTGVLRSEMHAAQLRAAREAVLRHGGQQRDAGRARLGRRAARLIFRRTG